MSSSLVTGMDYVHVLARPDKREDARWFYGSVLGLRELPNTQGVLADAGPLWFALGDGCQLRIAFEPLPQTSGPTSHLALRVVSLAAVVDALKVNGFEVSMDSISDQGGWRCFCRDPFGNRLEFVECPTADARGAA